jgi:hypothetical protein
VTTPAVRTILIALLITLLIALLAGCGSVEPQPLRFGDATWQDGETTSYRVTDINGDYAGTATFSVSRGTPSAADGWTLRRDLLVQGDQEISVVEMGAVGFRPQSSTVVRITPDGTEQVKASYGNSQANMELTTTANVLTYEQRSVPSDARDLRSLPLIVRALPLEPRYAAYINTFFPVTGRLERVTVAVEEQEQVTTVAGSFDTWRVTLTTLDNESTLWINTQPPYPLVKFEDGRNGAIYELESFAPAK